jgi:hypothetical protein
VAVAVRQIFFVFRINEISRVVRFRTRMDDVLALENVPANSVILCREFSPLIASKSGGLNRRGDNSGHLLACATVIAS